MKCSAVIFHTLFFHFLFFSFFSYSLSLSRWHGQTTRGRRRIAGILFVIAGCETKGIEKLGSFAEPVFPSLSLSLSLSRAIKEDEAACSCAGKQRGIRRANSEQQSGSPVSTRRSSLFPFMPQLQATAGISPDAGCVGDVTNNRCPHSRTRGFSLGGGGGGGGERKSTPVSSRNDKCAASAAN